MSIRNEFQEIGHCGGKFTVEVETSMDGNRRYQLAFVHDRPTPATIVAFYALPQGIPVGVVRLGGIGQSFNPPPFPNCFTIFVSSDVKGKFGHECPECKGYWRSGGATALKLMTCPYCGVRGEGYQFITKGQRIYIERCCNAINEALDSLKEGKLSISMDDIADAAGKDCEKPPFYYAEESQQNQFNCKGCDGFNDILGKFGYCSRCGKHNFHDELMKELDRLKTSLCSIDKFENSLRDAVAVFDSVGRCFSKQLAYRVPMTERREKEWQKKIFHGLNSIEDQLSSQFDISLFKNFQDDEKRFIRKMFLRRHVYEHNGGIVDERYISESGDDTVRIGQLIYESKENVLKAINLVERLSFNLDAGFHSIFKTY